MKRLLFASACLLAVVGFPRSQEEPQLRSELLFEQDLGDLKNVSIKVMRVSIPPGLSTDKHVHKFTEFVWVMDGDLTVYERRTGVEVPVETALIKGDTYASPVNTVHWASSVSGAEALVIDLFPTGENPWVTVE